MKCIKVAAGILTDGKKIYATRRGYGKFRGGWEFPGGKTEEGETSEETVIRELKEELGITAEPYSFFDRVEYDYDDFHLSMDCYLCRITEGEPVLKEHLEARWLTKETADSVAWLPADKDLIDSALPESSCQTGHKP